VTAPDNGPAGQLGDKYRRIAAVGQGGMADVWLVVMLGPAGFSKLLALKELKPEYCSSAEFVAMVMAEARLAARLGHPNIVQTFEVGLNGRRPGIVMEWLDGQSLLALQRQSARGGVPLAAQVFILAQVLEALEYAHEMRDYDGTPLNIVHRDVSPHNVLVGYNGSVKLMDFGIAKVAGVDANTKVGQLKGKVGYVAPEQIVGDPVDRRTDVFAAGVMLWEAIVGRRLGAGIPRDVTLARRVQGIHEPVLRLVPGAPRELAAVVDRAMARWPADRYPTAAAMRADLETWLAGQRISERQVAALVTAAFADERRHMQKLIEQQMCALRPRQPSAPDGASPVALDPPSKESAATSTPMPTSAGRQAEGGVVASLSMPFGVSTSAEVEARRKRRWLALPVAALALGAVAASLRWQAPGPEAVARHASTALLLEGPSSAASTTAAAPAAPEPSPREFELTVTARPAGAKVYLDGKLLGRSPVRRHVARDDQAHVLRLSAPGFRDDEHALTFSQSQSVEVALKPLRRGRPAPKALDDPKAERAKQPGRKAGSGEGGASPR
jgi:eukaryotic-like serine/threonine-protein kinase